MSAFSLLIMTRITVFQKREVKYHHERISFSFNKSIFYILISKSFTLSIFDGIQIKYQLQLLAVGFPEVSLVAAMLFVPT